MAKSFLKKYAKRYTKAFGTKKKSVKKYMKRKAVAKAPPTTKRTKTDKSGLFWAGRKKKSNPWNAYIKSTCAPGYKKAMGK